MKKKIYFLICFLFFLIPIGTIATEANYPVDLVYIWVDGNDPIWKEKKDYWQSLYMNLPESSTDIARFRELNELKYSLRSVEKNLPWINHIFIVTDRQIPHWLNTKHPKITIIDHTEIFPSDALPTFNSGAIEAVLPFIPGLSEHFLFANDDYYVRVPLKQDFFFDSKGDPKVYVKYKKQTYDTNLWLAQIKYAHEKVSQAYPLNFVITPSHNMQAYRKSYFLEAINEFKADFNLTIHSQFRQPTDINRVIVELLDNMQGRNTMISKWDVEKLPSECKTAFSLIARDFETLSEEEPCLFCLNDFEGKTEEERIQTNEILESYFPQKSSFEK